MADPQHLTVELRTGGDLAVQVKPPEALPDSPPKPWVGVLKILGVLLAGSSWVVLVGGAVLWIRLDEINVPPTPAVSVVPTELLLAIGVRALVLPLAIGLLAFGLLLVISALTGEGNARRTRGNTKPIASAKRGESPHGIWEVLFLVWLVLVAAAIFVSLSFLQIVAVAVGGAIVLSAGFFVVQAASGISEHAAALFVVAALTGGLFSLAVEEMRPVKLDLATAVRKSGAAIPGYFMGRSGDQLFLITAGSPAQAETNEAKALVGTTEGTICDAKQIRFASGDCYVQRITSIPVSDLALFTIGPRDVEVTPEGFRGARALAKRAARGVDEYPPPPQPKQSASHEVKLHVSGQVPTKGE